MRRQFPLRLIAATFLAALLSHPASAQTIFPYETYVVAACPPTLATPWVAGQTNRPVTIDTNGQVCAVLSSSNGGYGTATPITGNATGTTGAVVGTLAAAASKTTYICGFDVSAIGGTAAVGPITVAGLKGSSAVYQLASTAAGVTLGRTYSPCIPASAANTAITITTTADGTASAVSVNSWGFQQ